MTPMPKIITRIQRPGKCF